MPDLLTVDAYRRAARDLLPPPMWGTLFGDDGAPGWESETNNVAGFDAIALRPRILVDIAERRLATTALGAEISLPVLIAPSGAHQRYRVEGELATARAAGRAGTIMALSTASTYSIEEVAEVATGPLWFQLYFLRDRRLTERLVRRAEEAGFRAIVLTVDMPGVSSRERDARFVRSADDGYDLTAEHRVAETYDVERELCNFRHPSLEGLALPTRADFHAHFDPSLTWADLAWLREVTSLPLVLKGVQTGEDAALCAEHGLDGLVVSNHGGFALPDARATIETLPEIAAAAAAGPVEVYLDGGVRRGTDVLKALALGARAVLVGRAQAWGLTVGGEDGIVRVLEILRAELDDAMRLCGVTDVTAVPRRTAS